VIQVATRKILSISIGELSTLCCAYMPFLINGGLFIASTEKYAMGAEVFLLLKLLDETERIPVAGRIAWLTPASCTKGRVDGRLMGIGIQFNDPEQKLKTHIETLLAAASRSEFSDSTQTL